MVSPFTYCFLFATDLLLMAIS